MHDSLGYKSLEMGYCCDNWWSRGLACGSRSADVVDDDDDDDVARHGSYLEHSNWDLVHLYCNT